MIIVERFSHFFEFLVVILVLFASFQAHVMFARSTAAFSDVSADHPYFKAISDLKNRGIISGYPDGTFKPNRTVNRVEALKMIVLANNKLKARLSLADKTTIIFQDTPAGSWYIQYLNFAYYNAMVAGYHDGKFRPEKPINLVESLKIALGAWDADLSKITVLENSYTDAFKDQWYAKHVEYAKVRNLIDSDVSNKIYPDQRMTRGKLAEMIYRLTKTILPSSSEERPSRLVNVKSWLYLIGADLTEEVVRRIENSSYDMVVIQYIPSEKGMESYNMTETVRRLHNASKPKLVIAYIDIGQAEAVRTYWKNSWRVGNPDWIVSEDPDGWSGNYPVGYWRKEWRDIWIGQNGYMNGIVGDGFDGIYLDWVEAYSHEPVKALAARDGVNSETEMVRWANNLADYGRSHKADFIVIGQNAAELTANNREYFRILDAIAQEQIWFDGAAEGPPEGDCPLPQRKTDVNTAAYYKNLNSECRALYDKFPDSTLHISSEEYLEWLTKIHIKGMPVFTVDYAMKKPNTDQVYKTSRQLGFIPFVGRRNLEVYIEPTP